MLAISFENDFGRLWLSGSGGLPLRLLAAEGLGLGGKECNVTSYAGQSGQVLLSEKDAARVITLSFDVSAVGGHLREELSRMMRILYHAGRLTVVSGNRRRVIGCRCTAFEEPERHGRELAALVVQFTCDMPYFTDEVPQSVNLFLRSDKVRSSFTLPCVFTERTNRLLVTNRGDVCAEPVFMVHHAAQDEASALDEAIGLELINHTTGQRILVEHGTVPDETVTIDIAERQITSDIDGDITHTLSQDSYLSDFWLDVGVNDVEAVNYNTAARIGVVMRYDNRYVEAIW